MNLSVFLAHITLNLVLTNEHIRIPGIQKPTIMKNISGSVIGAFHMLFRIVLSMRILLFGEAVIIDMVRRSVPLLLAGGTIIVPTIGRLLAS